MALHHEVLGRSGPGVETVLLSAGLGGTSAFWAPQVESLAAHHRVILYDQRGTGRSAEPLPDDHSVEAMADDVAAILDATGTERCHLVGHALGGLIGLGLARRAPERLASLVLVNAWARLDSHTRRCFAMRLALLDHVGPEAYVRAQPIFLYPAAWLSANAERIARDDEAGLAHFQGADTLRTRVRALSAFDALDDLGKIAVPTLVAASRDDVLVPWTASRTLAAGLQRARLWTVAEGGHGFTAVEPAPFNEALLRFLAEPDAGAPGATRR